MTKTKDERGRFLRESKKPTDGAVLHGDTGKQNKRQRMLRVSEVQFRDLAEKSLVGIYLIQDGFFKLVNPRFAQIFGYEVDEISGKKKPEELVHPEDRFMVAENIRKRISGEADSFHYEFRGLTKDGETVNVEVYGSRTSNQRRPALIGTLLDVTRRKHARETLKQAEEKYRSIFENAVEGMFQTTRQGQFIVANPALAKMLGYESPDEFVAALSDIGQQLYVEPARRSEFLEIQERVGSVIGFECELYKKDRSRILVLINSRAVRDNDDVTQYYEGSVEDVTERRKAADALNRLNEFNKVIINNAPVAIFTLDEHGVFTSVNPALASLSDLGPRAEEKLIGFNWLKNPYTIKCGLAGYIKRGLAGEAFQLWDFPFVSYRGDRNLYMDFKGVPLRGEDGNIEGLLCIIEETTDRVRTRAKLMQEAKMAAIGRLAAGIAHELNNPLATLVAYAELASQALEPLEEDREQQPSVEELRNYLGIVEEQAFRCKNVITDILSLPRKDGLEPTVVDVNRLLDSVIELANIEKSGITIAREFDTALPHVKGDISALRQVFVNLISNGIDAVEGTLGPTLWIRTRIEGRQVGIEIEDNGVGIPDSIVDKIFEPFYTTKESKKGIGLGLSLCSELIDSMSGTIRVESKPRYGTTFIVTLPIDDTGQGGGD
ncbi:MAG: Sporulation kinase E [Syntrophorhabdus sp. PtaB.Bin006]|nr:MAG: Sporulation kinase E [Syntrophorhabdus sp. PtaB.Bin006]